MDFVGFCCRDERAGSVIAIELIDFEMTNYNCDEDEEVEGQIVVVGKLIRNCNDENLDRNYEN